jgi:hypothetical protein
LVLKDRCSFVFSLKHLNNIHLPELLHYF